MSAHISGAHAKGPAVRSRLIAFIRGSSGITSVEYALLLALLGATVAGAALLLGLAVEWRIGDSTTQLNE